MVERARAMVLLQHGNSSGGGGRGSMPKKGKPNKVPQRGLGVAQLEKIRLEEQQKNAGAASVSHSSALVFQAAQHPPLPFFPATDPELLIRPPAPVSSTSADLFRPAMMHRALEGPSARTGGYLPVLWGSVEPGLHDGEATGKKYDASGLRWRSCSILQRRRQQQNLLVNSALSPPSSGASLQIEPPSNQSYSSTYTMPASWPDAERVVGMKRPCPFRLDAAPPNHHSFPCKMPPFARPFLDKDDPLPIYGSDAVKNTTMALREGASGSSSHQVDWKSSHKSVKENGSGTDGGFLSLGPPPKSSFSKSKQYLSSPHQELNFQPSQASRHDAISENEKSGQLPFYSFLPMAPDSQETSPNARRGETLDGLDLNLKL